MRHRKTITIPKSREQVLEESLNLERAMRASLARYDAELEEIPQSPIPKYVPPPKRKLTAVELLQAPKLFLQQYLP